MQDGEKTEVKRNVEEYNMDETERRNEVKQELHQYTENLQNRKTMKIDLVMFSTLLEMHPKRYLNT